MVANSQLFLLIFVRILALLEVAPLVSSTAIPQLPRIALAFLSAIVIFPNAMELGYAIPDTGLAYVGLLIGEIMLGLIQAFFLVLIFSSFQVAGQFFSLQMGFGASQVFDPLAQVQIPLMGQFLNVLAMFTFISVNGFPYIFLVGVDRSFQAVRAVDLLGHEEYLFEMLLNGLSMLFLQALIIALPILGTLMLISVSMGLMSKAAPQMNLLMMGFPISIGVAFLMLFICLPFIMEAFAGVIQWSFEEILKMLDTVSSGGPA
ncbi:MAG: flagellar biosynthetic protein FliR [Spirochaetia bacterium]